MLKTRLIGIKWLCFNIGLFETVRIFLNIFLKNKEEHLIKFRFNSSEVKMFIKNEITDMAMLTEIFCFEAYEIRKNIDPKLIIDGGANKGSAAIYFGLKYPKAKIHCYEPNVELIPILKKNIEINKINAEVFNEALSDREGDLFFEINENHQYSKLSYKDTGLKVKAVSLNSKYVGKKIDILKLDVEGEEEKIISSINFDQLSINTIIQEVHYDRVSFEKIKKKLESCDYFIDKPYPQYKWLNAIENYPILVAVKINSL